MSQSVILVASLLLAVALAQEPRKKHECNNNSECKPFHFCFHSYWFGR